MQRTSVEEAQLTVDGSIQQEPAGSGRRQFLRQAVIAGAGVAGLGLLAQSSASAAPVPELVLGSFAMNANSVATTLKIESQSGSSIVGRLGDGTPISGAVSGHSPDPVTISFTHWASDGSVQIFFGAISVRSVAGGRELFFAGTYSLNGIGPLPWTALGTAR